MKVNGKAFKKAREEIKKNLYQGRNRKLRGEASVGTQEWLAAKARIRAPTGEMKKVSLRTIQYLEKGEASIQVVDAVSPFLGINGRELILNYGIDTIKLNAISSVDFRPVTYPLNSSCFHRSAFLMSIDPLTLMFSSDDIDKVLVKNMTAKLEIDDLIVNFRWLYEVSLTPNGNGWLGIKNEIYPFEMSSPSTYRSPIMFSQQTEMKLSWCDFLDAIKKCESNLLQIKLKVDFSTFEKNLKIGISTSQICSIIKHNMNIKNSDYPHYLQPDTLIWRD